MPQLHVRALLLTALLAGAAPGVSHAQTPAEAARSPAIHGRVVDAAGKGVAGADVRVTHARTRAEARAKADSAGRFRVAAPGDGGAFQVLVSVGGRPVASTRVTMQGTQRDAEVRLQVGSGEVRLDTLRALARRRQAPRGQAFGDQDGVIDGRAAVAPASVTPGSEGSIEALAALVPGVQLTPAGPSVLGMGADQNTRTLNGLTVGDVDLPRDMRSSLQVATSPWDPARGGFSGAQLTASIPAGGTFATRSASFVLDGPVQRLTDPALAHVAGQGPRTVLGAGGSGELVPGRYYYSAGISATLSRAGASDLLRADAEALRLAGIHPDSAARLVAALRGAGVALGAAGGRVQDAASFTVRLDRDPNGSRRANLLAFGKVDHSDALRQTPRSTPGYAGSAWGWSTGLSAGTSHYLWTDYLHEPTLGVTFAGRRGTPRLSLPGGRVLVSSDAGAGQPLLTSVNFGGNSLESFRSSEWTVQLRDELQWLARGNTVRRKLYLESVLAGFSGETAADRMGSYEYRSLADLAENRPYRFRRQFGSTEAEGRQWTGALAWADSWSAGKGVQLVYGARVDANRFLDAPRGNPALREAFGVRTDRMPNGADVSPRLGFTWNYRPRRTISTSGALGQASFWRGGLVQGGFGRFRGSLPTSLLDDALRGTGLAGGLRELNCVGEAVPAPDWRAFLENPSTVPDECAAGAAGAGTLTDLAPRVQLFGDRFRAPHSWRASLGWSGSMRKVSFGVDGTRSWNRAVASRRDLNFGGDPRFLLAAEGNRPVFVSPAAISAPTGATSAVEARLRPELGRVDERSSDLHSSAWQLTGRVTPDMGWTRRLSLSYTLAGGSAQARGFDAAAFGDPRAVETARGFQARHQVMLHAALNTHGVSVSLFGRLTSGVPFTPVVAGDVNGDGAWLDRAFVFDPAAVPDSALAAGMRGVLDAAPSYARECIRGQLGRAAERNSCTGPWTQSLDASIAYAGMRRALGRRVGASLYLANLPGAVDQLLHGSRGLRGWGTQPLPDPVLLTVRGFDPEARAFRYEANAGFGGPRSTLSAFGTPFRVTLDVRLDLGKSQDRQAAERIVRVARTFAAGQSARPEEVMKLAFPARVVSAPEQVLNMREALALDAGQVDSLRAAAAAFNQRADSMKMALAREITAAGQGAEVSRIIAGRRAVEDAMRKLHRESIPRARALLSPAQVELLPSSLREGSEGYMVTTQTFRP